ncbi:MAG TPA: hypothetical protein VFU22_22515 [Roseiflexaceae bacterium]|nr:hypothetical protein [Roseiflexaceae bacterium]
MSIQTESSGNLPAGVRLIAQALGGALLGLVFGAIAGTLGGRLFEGAEGFGNVVAAILGAIIGYTIGVSIGVYLIGRRLGVRGAYWRALLGGAIGSVLVMLAAEPLRLNNNPAVLQAFLIGVPPIVAALGFNMGHKARR